MISLGNALDNQVEFIAAVERRPPDELLVDAVSRYCLAQLANPAFRERAHAHIQWQKDLLDRLGQPTGARNGTS